MVAPLLLALGVRPVYAVLIPLLGHAWANMFGTLAVGWLATLQVVELENQLETAFQTGILLLVVNPLAGLTIAYLYGKMPAVTQALPMIAIISLVHSGGQLALMLWEPILSTFLAATVALALLYPLSRWRRYSEPAEQITERPAMREEPEEAEEEREEAESEKPRPVMGLRMALMPYVVLTVVAVLIVAIPPVEETLEQFEVGLPFPETQTNFGFVAEGEEEYQPFAPLTHPGTFLLVAAAVGYAVYRARGYFQAWEERQEDTPQSILAGLVGSAVPASFAIVAFLITSALLEDTGQTDLLALGLAAVSPPLVFAFVFNLIGVLGAFMTSSNTASNILFASLQQTVAETEGLSEAAIIGAQSTGGPSATP